MEDMHPSLRGISICTRYIRTVRRTSNAWPIPAAHGRGRTGQLLPNVFSSEVVLYPPLWVSCVLPVWRFFSSLFVFSRVGMFSFLRDMLWIYPLTAATISLL